MMEQKLKQSGSAAAEEVNLKLRLSGILGVSVGAVAR
jgi:hypothetical protein